MRDAHRKFVNDLHGIETDAKAELQKAMLEIVKKCLKASGGNMKKFVLIFDKAKKVAMMKAASVLSPRLKTVRTLSAEFAQAKVKNVQR